MDTYLTLNITFNITNPLHDEIVNASMEIKKEYGSKWYIDDKRYHLHFPMYLFAVPKGNEEKIKKGAKEYYEHAKRLKINSKDMTYTSSGLIMINFSISEDIYELHKLALQIFNPIRNGFLREKHKNQNVLDKYSMVDKENLLKYGSIHVLDNYKPHITIASIKDSNVCAEIVNKYSDSFKNKESSLDRLQVLNAIFSDGDDDRTELLFDKKIY